MTNEEDVFSPDSLISKIERLIHKMRKQEMIRRWVMDQLIDLLNETGTPEQGKRVLAVLNKAAEMTGPDDTND